jgi:NYN domain-containing protein
VDRCALFVDAGYVLADGAMAVHGTRNRESVSWDYAGVLQFLSNVARDRTGLPLLRCYWYEATVESRRTPEHDALADLPGVKLRLGRMRPGRREGVEGEIHRDLTTLARNTAISDALVVSAEEDLTQVITDVQDLGIRVTILHITVDGNWTISRALRQECDDIVEIGEAHLRPYVELVVGAEPAREDERLAIGSHAGRATSNGHAAIGPLGRPALPAGSHSGTPAIYTAPVVAEYQRAAQPAPAQPAAGPPQPNGQSPVPTAAPGGAEHGQPPGQPLPRRGTAGQPRAAGQGEQPGGPAQGGHAPGQQGRSAPQAPQPGQQPQPATGLPQQVQVPVGLDEQQGPPLAAAAHGQHGMPGQPGPGGPPPGASQMGPPQHGFGQSNGLAAHSNGLGGQHGGFPGQPGGLGMPHSSSQSPHAAAPQPGPSPQPTAQPGQQHPGQAHSGQAQQAPAQQDQARQPGLPHPGMAGQPQAASQPQGGQSAGQPVAGGQPPAGQAPGPQQPAGQQPGAHAGQPVYQAGGGFRGPDGAPGQGPAQAGQQSAGAHAASHAAPAHAAPPPPSPGPPGGPQAGFPPPGVAQPVGAPGPLQAAGMPSGQVLTSPGAPAGGQGPAAQPSRPYQAGPGGQPGRYGQPEQRPGQPFAGPPPGHVEGGAPAAGQQAYVPQQGSHSGPQPPAQHAPVPPPVAVSLADAVQAAHGEGFNFGQTVARDAPALWLEAVLARKPRMPSDLEARLLQDSALPIDSLLHDEVRHALRRGFWDALERSRH